MNKEAFRKYVENTDLSKRISDGESAISRISEPKVDAYDNCGVDEDLIKGVDPKLDAMIEEKRQHGLDFWKKHVEIYQYLKMRREV